MLKQTLEKEERRGGDEDREIQERESLANYVLQVEHPRRLRRIN